MMKMDVMTLFNVSSDYVGSPSGKRGNQIASGYFIFTLCAVIVYRLFTDGDFSSIYTLGIAVQVVFSFGCTSTTPSTSWARPP